jgi:hypothetical protein
LTAYEKLLDYWAQEGVLATSPDWFATYGLERELDKIRESVAACRRALQQ